MLLQSFNFFDLVVITYIAQEGLLISIFSQKISCCLNDLNYISHLPDSISSKIREINFPQFSQNETKQIIKEIHNSFSNQNLPDRVKCSKLEQILLQHNFNLKFDRNLMNLISNNFDSCLSESLHILQNYEYLSILALFMYIAWMFENSNKNSEINNPDFFALLECLLKISEGLVFFLGHENTFHQGLALWGKIQPFISSAFFNAYAFYLSATSLGSSSFTILIDKLNRFFSLRNLDSALNNLKFSPIYFSMLSILFDHLFGSKSVHVNLSKTEVYHLFDSVGKISNINQENFPLDVCSFIILMILPQLSNLEEEALKLFCDLVEYQTIIEDCDIFRYINVIIDSIKDEVLKQESPYIVLSENFYYFIQNSVDLKNNEKVPEKYKQITLPPLTAPEVTLRIWEKDVFESGITSKINIVFPDKISYNALIPEKIRKKLKFLMKSIQQKEELIDLLLDKFVSILNEIGEDHPFKLDFVAILLFIGLHCGDSNFCRKEDLNNFLLQEPIFDPKLTVFDNKYQYMISHEYFKKDLEIINAFRSGVIDLALKNLRPCFEVAFLKYISHPLMFAEITHRMIRDQRISINPNAVTSLSKSLMTASMYYQPLHYNIDDKETTVIIEISRTSIFLFILHLMNSSKTQVLLYSNHIFVSFFLSFLFEVSLRKFILSNLLLFLSKQDTISDSLVEMLSQIIQICSPSFPDEKFVTLVFDMIQTLIDVLTHRRSITEYFEPLCAPIFASLNQLTSSGLNYDIELLQHYILLCVQFFALTAFTQTVSFPQIAILEKAIQTIFSHNIPQQLVNRLIQMMAGEISPTLTPTFIIHQPKVLQLFMKISLNDVNFLEKINFVDQLCQFSALNCQRCRLSDFDLFLIDLIQERTEPKIVSALLNLFQHIATSNSSVSVVQRFISLLAPKDGRTIHMNMPLYLNTMNNIISSAVRLPVVSMPLNRNSSIVDVQGFSLSDLDNSFTFLFWIYVDTTNAQYKPNIFCLTDSRSNKIEFFLSSTFLFCTQRSKSFESNGKIDEMLPIQTWSFVSVTYKRIDNEDTEVQATFGMKKMKALEFITIPFQSGPISLRIGGVTDDSLQSDTFSRLGSFGLFRALTFEEITSIAELGPRLTGSLPINNERCIFFHNITENQGLLALETKYSMPGIDSKISKSSIKFNNTFSDILINYCKVEILLPLFSLLDMKLEDGSDFENAVKYAVEIIGNTLMISNRAHESFLRGNGFEIISHLLINSSSKHVDYTLYTQFFALMQSFTNTEMQISIAKNILLNINIWIQADPDSHLRILKHWNRVLFPSFKSIFNEQEDLISFKDILYLLRVYYWYYPLYEEKDIIKTKRCNINHSFVEIPHTKSFGNDISSPPKSSIIYNKEPNKSFIEENYEKESNDLNVFECRQQLNHIALMLANDHFSANDFNCLASYIWTSPENKQTCDNLMLLKDLILSSSKLLEPVIPLVDPISYLYSLFIRKDEDIIILIIENIFLMYTTGLINHDLLMFHIEKIQERFTPLIANESIFRKLTEIMVNDYQNFSELLPICSFIALYLDDNTILWFFSQVDFSIIHSCNKNIFWFLWPIVLIYHCIDITIAEQLIKYLLQIDGIQWDIIFSMIYNIGLVLNENSHNLLSLFLEYLIDNAKIDESNATLFFSLATFHLFFRTVKNKNPQDIKNLQKEEHLNTSPLYSFWQSQENNIPFQYVEPRKKSFYLTKRSPSQCEIRYSENLKMQSKSYSMDIHELYQKECPCPLDILKVIGAFTYPMPQNFFGLVFEPDGSWADIKIAKEFMKLFSKYKSSNLLFLDCDMVITSYCSMFDYDYSVNHVKALNLTSNDFIENANSLDFLNHHFLHNGKSLIYLNQTNLQEIEEGAFKFIQEQKIIQRNNNSINRMCRNFALKMKEISNKWIKNQYSKKQIDYSASQIHLTSEFTRNKEKLINNGRNWMKLWRCLAIDNAPWDCNTQRDGHFKRDNTLCTDSFVPFKIKRNWKFVDHKNASPDAEPDSNIDAEDNEDSLPTSRVMQEDLRKRETKYLEKAPMPLLEIRDSEYDHFDNDIIDNLSYLHCLKRVILEAPMEYIKPTTTTKHEELGTFYLTKENIVLIFKDETRTNKIIPLSDILHVFLRKSYHLPNSIEIITTNGRSYYLHFRLHNSLTILKKIASLQPSNAIYVQTLDFPQFFNSHSKTDLWVTDQISNFEYLMHLNMMSGRTFNDLTQYPIFPWVIGDYKSSDFSLKSDFMRDLRKPIGAIGQDRLDRLLFKFKKNHSYIYDKGNINIADACEYLMRLEPFTTEYISINNGKFGRNFTSIPSTFESVTSKEHDYREMIPEFFFMPEILLNLNLYPIEPQGNGNVKLPNWAKTADEFIYLQRKALESDYVSNTLHHWIDLTWGIKQHGQEAISAMNVYLPEMYETIWDDLPNLDPQRRAQIESILLCIGQVPPQLFTSSHPPKTLVKDIPLILKQPSIIAPHSLNPVSIARMEISSSNKCKIVIITNDGTMVSHYADFSFVVQSTLYHPQNQRKSLNSRIDLKSLYNNDSDSTFAKVSSAPVNTKISYAKSFIATKSNPLHESINVKLPRTIPRGVSNIDLKNESHLLDDDFNNLTNLDLNFTVKEIPNFSEYKVDVFNTINSIAHLLNGIVAGISSLTNKVVLIDIRNGRIEEIPNQVSDAVAVAASGDLLAVAYNDAVLNIFKCNNFNKPLLSMPSYRDSISCCCISQLFFVTVIGIRDGSIIINSLNKGSTVRVINLKCARPIMVTMTPGWGFIVVYATKLKDGVFSHYLYVFNVNGIRLRKKKLGFEIIAWAHYKSNKGFDYMFISDSRGKLFEFEVFYLNIGESFFRCHSPIASLSYLKDIFAVVVVTKDGRVIFIPHTIR